MKIRRLLAGGSVRIATWLGLQPLLELKRHYLSATGWLLSFELKEPVDACGRPIPWMTYACIAFLEPRIRSDMTVFEYGTGGSTLWWAERVRRVVCCEHDLGWLERMRPRYGHNVTAEHVPLEYGGAYSQEVARHREEFDIVVIDGRDRVNCARHCVGSLRAGGVVLWDNTDRNEYREGLRWLESNGFQRLDFWSSGPIVPYGWCTSVLYRPDNCLGI